MFDVALEDALQSMLCGMYAILTKTEEYCDGLGGKMFRTVGTSIIIM